MLDAKCYNDRAHHQQQRGQQQQHPKSLNGATTYSSSPYTHWTVLALVQSPAGPSVGRPLTSFVHLQGSDREALPFALINGLPTWMCQNLILIEVRSAQPPSPKALDRLPSRHLCFRPRAAFSGASEPLIVAF